MTPLARAIRRHRFGTAGVQESARRAGGRAGSVPVARWSAGLARRAGGGERGRCQIFSVSASYSPLLIWWRSQPVAIYLTIRAKFINKSVILILFLRYLSLFGIIMNLLRAIRLNETVHLQNIFFLSLKWDFVLNWSECKIITNYKMIF